MRKVCGLIAAVCGYSVLVPVVATSQVRPITPPTAELTISAALVDGEMQVRPVPLHGLRLVSGRGDTVLMRTRTDGTASGRVRLGTYRLESISPLTFQGRQYSWNLPIEVVGERGSIALSNDNATVSGSGPVAAAPTADSRLDPSAAIFSLTSGSVFRVEAGLGHGTGFLADTLGGVIVTNAHVVEGAEEGKVSVVLDSITRVRADILALDSDADIAILRVHGSVIEGRQRLVLQRPVGRTPVVPGERLVAMGFPLTQELTMTAGIASSIRAGAIISDVNINPGNSGGPLLNTAGEVVAINTFGEASGRVGPGVAGSILVGRAGPALARAAVRVRDARPPRPDLLPLLPREALNVTTMKAFADTADVKRYRKMSEIGIGGFDVTVQTPAQTFVAMKLYEGDVGKDRKKREALSNLPEAQRYSEVREYRDWGEYVGEPALPVISLSILPRMGETGGSLFKRMLLGVNLQATYRFQGDLRSAAVFRDEGAVEPIKGGHAPMSVYQENRWVSLKDVADRGFYVFDAELFRPSVTGVPPSIVIALTDLKNPKKLKCRELSPEVVANVWNDFQIFYEQLRPAAQFVRADPKLAKGRKTAGDSDFLKGECDWSY